MSLAVRQIATYQEIRTHWDIDELYAMHEILDIQADLEADEIAEMRAKAEARRR